MRLFALLLSAFVLCSCTGDRNASTTLDVLDSREVKMPNGQTIRAEAMIKPVDLQRGLMFRESLPQGRGMLFLHKQAGPYQYWMYQVKFPLDIVFIDSQHRVLGVAAAVPCKTRSSECPQYGNHPGTQYVLEVNAGEAARYGVTQGASIGF